MPKRTNPDRYTSRTRLISTSRAVSGALIFTVPPTTAERLKQGNRIAIAGSANLNLRQQRLLIGTFGIKERKSVDLAQIQLTTGDIEAFHGGVLGCFGLA